MHPGDLVDHRFRLLHSAGAGGMGEIYKAVDQETGAPVAIKIMTERRRDEAPRFAREVRILAELDHPQIVRYVAHGTLPTGEPYLAMEWLDGEDLSTRLSRGRLDAGESIALGLRVAEALGFAHARGVVHRDLKPSNIFLPGGQIEAVKLLDFGIAQLDVASRMTRTGMLMGTPGYMAPEQARGEGQLDARADVFSLGCVLFECLTGEPAYTGVHFVAVLARILFDEPPRLREKCPELPQALEALLDRLLARSPEDRPRDGQAVAEALHALGKMPSLAMDVTLEEGVPPKALTSSERRAVAMILIRAPKLERGSTDELRNAETMDARLDEPLRCEAEAHGGHFERLLDGAVAVMLTSTTMATDLAAQAARCALALRAHASGRVIALALGRAATTERLPMGQAIDRAARLIGASSSDDGALSAMPIVLDDVTAGLLDARFDVREREAGFVLHSERELAEGTRTLLGKATPCVGRDWELGALERLFDECLEERVARAVLVTGPAGGGKSRLGLEFLRHVKESSAKVAVWHGRGDPLRAGSAFGLLGQCLRRACGILDGEPLELRREKLVARVNEHVAEREQKRVTEFLGEIIGTPFPDEDNLPLRAARRDAQLMNDQMQAAFLAFLADECTAGPVLIGFEDLHWGDRPTVQFLNRALRDLREQPLFVIALARPEVHELFPKLWSERGLQEIRLKQLNRKAIERLARHVLGARADRETIERLERLSEGNAFYLEELLRCAAEGRGDELPETVVAMVQSRLGALDDEARRILRAASIFGEAFWAGGVAALLGGAERAPRVRERLRELTEREVIIKRGESRFPGEEEVAFRHVLLREGAYVMLTEGDRALGHRLAGEWLEQRGEQDMLVLAEHFEKGGEGEHAGHCYLRAAEQAVAGGDAPATAAYAHRGLACPVPQALRVRLLGTLCESVGWNIDSLSTALPAAQELVQVAERGSGAWVLGMYARLMGALQGGRFEEFMGTLSVLHTTDPKQGTGHPLALAFTVGAYSLDLAGRLQEASTQMDRFAVIALAMKNDEPIVSVAWHVLAGARDVYAGKDPWRALGRSESAVALAGALGHVRYVGLAHLLRGMSLWYLGACADAERTLKGVLMSDEEFGYMFFMRLFSLAWLLADRGDLPEARACASRLLEARGAQSLPLDESHGRWALAEVLRRAGESDAAEPEIQAALPILRMVMPLDYPGALATLAALRLSQQRPAEALAVAEEALAKTEAMGACSFFFRDAFLHLTHAECLEATGDHAAARTAIAKARQWILAVADKIGDLTYRKTYLENVPENRRTLELARQWLDEGP